MLLSGVCHDNENSDVYNIRQCRSWQKHRMIKTEIYFMSMKSCKCFEKKYFNKTIHTISLGSKFYSQENEILIS